MEFELIIIFLSILFSAFFSGMEIAFVSSNKLQIEIEKQKGGFFSNVLSKITKNPSKFITTMLIGNNIALVIYGYYMGALLIGFIEPYVANTFIVLIAQTFISTVIILVTAEFLPKAIFRIFANEALLLFSLPAYFFYILFYFISIFISNISNMLLRVFFNTTEDQTKQEFSKEELGNFITEQLETTGNDEVDSEIHIFQNALNFHNVKAREVMIPRTEIVALDSKSSIEELKKMFVETSLSKIIIYKKSLDDIIGYVKAFELFQNPKTIKSILLPIEFVPESMTIKNILDNLSKKKKNVAIVLDEYGGTSGLITKEDIIEELFGEIEDEHDSIDLTEEVINNREFLLSARLEIDYLNKEYNLDFFKEDAYETLGGYIINHIEKIPLPDEVIIIEKYQFTIKKVISNKIEEVYLKIISIED